MGYFVRKDGVIYRAIWVGGGNAECNWEGEEGGDGEKSDEDGGGGDDEGEGDE